jgi:hypothetical protein
VFALLLALATPDIDSVIQDAVDPCRAARQANEITVCGRTKDRWAPVAQPAA